MFFRTVFRVVVVMFVISCLSGCFGDAVLRLSSDGSGYVRVIFPEKYSNGNVVAYVKQYLVSKCGKEIIKHVNFTMENNRLVMEAESKDIVSLAGEEAYFVRRDDGLIEVSIPGGFVRSLHVYLTDGKVRKVLDPFGSVTDSGREIVYKFERGENLVVPVSFVFEPLVPYGAKLVFATVGGVLSVIAVACGIYWWEKRSRRERNLV